MFILLIFYRLTSVAARSDGGFEHQEIRFRYLERVEPCFQAVALPSLVQTGKHEIVHGTPEDIKHKKCIGLTNKVAYVLIKSFVFVFLYYNTIVDDFARYANTLTINWMQFFKKNQKSCALVEEPDTTVSGFTPASGVEPSKDLHFLYCLVERRRIGLYPKKKLSAIFSWSGRDPAVVRVEKTKFSFVFIFSY